MGHLQTTIIVNKATKSCLHTNTFHSIEHGRHKYNSHETLQNKTSIQSCNDVTTSSSFSITLLAQIVSNNWTLPTPSARRRQISAQ